MSEVLRAPHLRDLHEARRSSTPLELFFDLAFTAVISEVAGFFADRPTVERAGQFVLLFLPVVWTWVQVTLYGNRFDTDDAVHRVMKVMTMLGVAVMGISVARVLHGRSVLYMAGFLFARAVLLAMYARTVRVVDGDIKRSVRDYLLGYGAGALVWLSTLLLPSGARPLAWGLIVVAEMIVPYIAWGRFPGRAVNVSHLTDRFGSFAILVLGEGWLAIVGGVSEAGLVAAVLVTAAGLFMSATTIWWTYFDYTETIVLESGRPGVLYVYAHVLLLAGLGLAGAAAEVIVRHSRTMTVEPGSRAALIGGAAAFVAALAFLRRIGSSRRNAIPSTVRIAALAALIVLASVPLPLPPPVLIAVVTALLLLVFVVEVLEGHPQRPQSQANE